MTSIIITVLILLGVLFCLIAAIGILRFNDFYLRIHAATKAGAFGGSLLALAGAVHFGSVSAWVQSLMIIVFFYLTAPVAAHMISRPTYFSDETDEDTDTSEKE